MIEALPKKRGRPPKAKYGDDFSNITGEEDPAEPVAKRKRGRPKKSAVDGSSTYESASNLVSLETSVQTSKDEQSMIEALPKKRGRPPKAKYGDDFSNITGEEDPAEPVAKRKRGRPKKSAVDGSSTYESASNLVSLETSVQTSKDEQSMIEALPKKRGRPPKAKYGDDLSNITGEED